MPYFHVVFTLPAEIADIAYQNKAVIYDLLFKASAETLLTIAADGRPHRYHLGAAYTRFQAKWPPVRRPESAPHKVDSAPRRAIGARR